MPSKISAQASEYSTKNIAMRGLAVVALVLVALAVASAKPRDERYTTKYDNVDLGEILKNKRLFRSYVNCLLGKGNCTPDGAELKKVLPDALKSECSKCSDKQKEGSRIIFRHLIEQERSSWEDLEKIYDPEQEYRKKYRAQAKQEGYDI